MGGQYHHELMKYCPPSYVLCVSSHFWPFNIVKFVLEKLDKNLGSADPPPLSWAKIPNFSKNSIWRLPLLKPNISLSCHHLHLEEAVTGAQSQVLMALSLIQTSYIPPLLMVVQIKRKTSKPALLRVRLSKSCKKWYQVQYKCNVHHFCPKSHE